MTIITGSNVNDILTGGTGNDLIDGLKGADQMSGGAGNDTYYVDNAKDYINELIAGGDDSVFSSVSYTLLGNIENLYLENGTAALNATGNDLDNEIYGNDKANVIDGGAGADIMTGGDGNDTYIADRHGDAVTEYKDGGIDTVKSSDWYELDPWVENLILTGTGDSDGYGNELDNKLTGNTGTNELDGGAGADLMTGGNGDDTYIVDNVGDKVVELANQGHDSVESKIDYTLAANVEELNLLVGTAIHATGNALDNTIWGNDIGNVIDGGKGADAMYGYKGDDVYYVDNIHDVVSESKNEGTDTIRSTITITISGLLENVENVELLGTTAINATGNDVGNTIDGNSGNNILDGGEGIDKMAGHKGNDTYVVDNSSDQVTEISGEGTDLVKSAVTYFLGDYVENLTLTGTGNISAFGNTADNVLTGNGGNNTLSGGAGKDTMIGGRGDDHYLVDNVGDKVVETVTDANGGGHDSVYSSIDFSLAALANVEDLYLTASGSATGNANNNGLYGTNGGDVFDGGGGADTMVGYGGNDTYHVDNIFDAVIEGGSSGDDIVISTVALTTAYNNVENYAFNTSAAVHFTGTADANEIHGGSGKDVLYAGGGDDILAGGAGDDHLEGGSGNDFIDGSTGADDLSGGAGNDNYTIDNIKDVVHESANEGVDWANTFVTLTHLFDHVENVEVESSGTINVTGNVLDNVIIGGAGNNTIDGGAGKDNLYGLLGNDILIGGTDADTFHFDRTPSGKNDGHDVIKDFAKGEDFLAFDEVIDQNNDGKVNLDDLLESISSIVDHGAGKDVDVKFTDGAVITFTGLGTVAGTSMADHLTTLVDASHIQVHA